MKKFIFLFLVFIGLNCKLKAQFEITDTCKNIYTAGFGFSRLHDCGDLGKLSSSNEITFSGIVHNVYCDFSFNFTGGYNTKSVKASDKHEHNIFNLDLGYLIPVGGNRFYMGPVIGWHNHRALYYNSRSIQETNYTNMDLGSLMFFRFNDFSGITTRFTNHQLGFTLHWIIFSSDYNIWEGR